MPELFMWPTPLVYLLIIGFERLFWRSRYEKIKASILPNFLALTAIVVVVNVLIFITNHVTICWK